MKKIKSQKGITLVALVITVIILIILAGITFTIVLGEDGLIAKTKRGAQNYQTAAADEQKILEDINAFMKGDIDHISGGQGGSGSQLKASDFYFEPTDPNWHVDNVADALDYLFSH